MTVKSPWSNSNGNASNSAEEGNKNPVGGGANAANEGATSSSAPGSGTAAGGKAAQRPKAVTQWSVVDVQKWFRRNCGDYYHLYWEKFLEQDISGTSLVRLSENSLLRLGVVHPEHRQAIWREIAKLRLRTNIVFLRDLERRSLQQQQQLDA